MKLYIAGSSKELTLASHMIDWSRDAGFEITYDWPEAIRKEGGTNPPWLSQQDKRIYARKDIQAVLEADILWCLGSKHASQGMYCELGAALALNIPCVFSGPRQSIFAYAVTHYFHKHVDAQEWLLSRIANS